MLMVLDLLADVCSHYANQAADQAAATEDRARREELAVMSQGLEHVRSAAPATLREAIQLVWLYALVAAVRNFGRMDVCLGDFYARDIDERRLTEADALRLLQSWWRLMAQSFPTWSNRVMLGGVGRPNPESADRFTLLALEATRTVKALLPQTSLRVSPQTPPAVWTKALDVIGEGGVFPILYGDEATVPGIASSFNVSPTEAEQYVASDCGEFSLEHRSLGSPNGTVAIAKVLEVTLHNGVDPVSGQAMGLPTGDFAQFERFGQLWEAFARQVEHCMAALPDLQMVLSPLVAETAPHLLWSLLYDDCRERGRGLFDGGARYRGILTETYGNITVADSLLAIKRVVFEARQLTPAQLLAAMAADFDGWE